jgi:hypothetical protein
MRDENKRVWDQLSEERRKVERLSALLGKLWDFVGRGGLAPGRE